MIADDVAALLAVPRSSVYKYARRLHAPLPAIRVGRHLRFRRSEIERWLTSSARSCRTTLERDCVAGQGLRA